MSIKMIFVFPLIFFLFGCNKEQNNDTDNIALIDENACLENNSLWGTVTDSWSTTNGQFSDDNATWIRSLIPYDSIPVTLYYQKKEYYPNITSYQAFGNYTIPNLDKEVYSFDIMMHQEYIGSVPYFYVKVETACYRGVVPITINDLSDHNLTLVTQP